MVSRNDFRDIATQFGSVARKFCTTISVTEIDLSRDPPLCRPDLLIEAIRLPDTDPWKRNEPEDGSEDFPVQGTAQETNRRGWSILYNLLKEKLGQDNLYWMVFDPTSEDNETIRGSLADDIADVYGDLKESLSLMDKNAIIAEVAIWNWRLLFYSHWGDHALSALRAIHKLLDEKIEDGELL
jgi:hypothetical protein